MMDYFEYQEVAQDWSPKEDLDYYDKNPSGIMNLVDIGGGLLIFFIIFILYAWFYGKK